MYFLHIPKTAGTSVRYWLQDIFSADDWLPCDILDEVKQFSREEINRFRFFSGHFGTKIYDYLDHYPLTTTWLREPVRREISHYNFIRSKFDSLKQIAIESDNSGWIDYYQNFKDKSLVELCQSDNYVGFGDNIQTRFLAGIYPSQEGPIECDQEILETAKTNLMQLFHFGFAEYMNPSIDLLCFQLRHPRRAFGLRLNQTQGKSEASGKITKSDAKQIAKINRYDVELYQFALEEFGRRIQKLWSKSLRQIDERSTDASQILEHYDDPAHSRRLKYFMEQNFQYAQSRNWQSRLRFDRICVDFRQPAFVSNWYQREEVVPGKFIRWAGPDKRSSVYLPLKANRDLIIRFAIRGCPNFNIVNNLKLEICNRSIPLRHSTTPSFCGMHEHFLMEGRIPSWVIQADQPFTEVQFVAPMTVEKKLRQQTRQVSFATDQIEVIAE